LEKIKNTKCVSDNLNIESRVAGLWALHELVVGGASIIFGVNLSLGAEGRFLVIQDEALSFRRFIPSAIVEDAGSFPSRTPIFGTRFFLVTQPIDTFESSLKSWPSVVVVPNNSLTYSISVRTGSLPATAPVTFCLRINSVSGPLIHEQEFPASDFPANTQVLLLMRPPFEFTGNTPVFTDLFSDEVITLKTDATVDPWFALDFQIFILEDLVSINTGTDRFLVDEQGDTISDDTGDLVLSGTTVAQ